MQSDAELLRAFEGLELTAARWTHREHVRVAFIYLQREPLWTAMASLRRGIQALNRTLGVRDTPTSGYHETLTVAWAHLIAAAMRDSGPFESSQELLAARPELLRKTALRVHYSRDRMLSPGAKAHFVEPDLTSLP